MSEFTLVYRTDDKETLVEVNAAWDRFAEENASPHLLSSLVLGRNLWDLIQDGDVQGLYRPIFARIREGARRAILLPFRCDAPNRRRFMEMEISPDASGGLYFRTRVRREEVRDPMPALNPRAERSSDFISMCSWCKRVRVAEDAWVEIEVALRELDLFAEPAPPQITHGICDDCFERVAAEAV